MIFFNKTTLMIYCYLEDYPYTEDDEYETIGFIDSENHSYNGTVFHILYYHNSFQSTMTRILELCKLNNIEMHILSQDNNDWSFIIKKRDIDNIKFILRIL